MAATQPPSENPVENEFLAIFGGGPYSPELFSNFEKAHPILALWRYIEPYNTMFLRFLNNARFSVSHAELADFAARFIYVVNMKDGLHAIRITRLPPLHMSTFSKGPPEEWVGTYRDSNIYNGDRMVARNVGYFNTFHEIGDKGVFCGDLGELISQIPVQFMTSGKSYYYTHYFIEERYQTHYVIIHMCEKL